MAHRWLYLTPLLFNLLSFTSFAIDEAPPLWPADARRDIQWLTTGVDRFPILLKRAETMNVTGTAILLPDAGKQAITPEHMVTLRSTLATLGWDTLLISPPEWPELAQSKEGWQLYESNLQPRLQAALERANELPGNKLIVAEGATAASLLHLYSTGKLPQPDALVVISPYLPDPALNEEIPAWFGISQYPLLDVYTPLDNRWAQATVTARAVAARKRGRMDFRQRQQALAVPNPGSQSWLSKQIHGWIDHLGW